jgi:fumarate hydratase class II
VSQHWLPALQQLGNALDDNARALASLIKIGRTHLQDATPMSLVPCPSSARKPA